MKKIYFLSMILFFALSSFSQQNEIKKTIVVPPTVVSSADTKAEITLNESQLIHINKGDKFLIQPSFQDMPKNKHLLKGVMKFMGAGLLAYETSDFLNIGEIGASKGLANVRPNILPSIAIGLTAALPDLLKATKKSIEPYISYTLYNERKEVIEKNVVKFKTKKDFYVNALAKQSGYLQVTVSGTNSVIANDLSISLKSSSNLDNVNKLTSTDAEGYTFGGEEFDGGGEESSAGWDMLTYITENGLDYLPEGDYRFNEDGTVTFTDANGSVTMDANDFINSLGDVLLEIYLSELANYSPPDPSTVFIEIGGGVYAVMNSTAAYDYHVVSNGNTCVEENMSFMAAMFGLQTNAGTFITYWENNFDPFHDVIKDGTYLTANYYYTFLSTFFDITPATGAMFSPSDIMNAIDKGGFLNAALSGITIGHDITISGYIIPTDNPNNPGFIYYDSATGQNGIIDYNTLIGEVTHTGGGYFAALVSGVHH